MHAFLCFKNHVVGVNMVNVNELKGIDLSNRYYDPTQPFEIENEFYRFYSNSEKYGGLNYEFKSDYYNAEIYSTSLSVFGAFDECFNKMMVNEFRVMLINDLFSDYEDVNFIDLFFDLTEDRPDEIRFLDLSEEEDYEKLLSYYQSILENYGITCDHEDLEVVDYFISSLEFYNDALCDDYDLEELLSENIEDSDNIRFKLAYILYLQVVNSAHNNSMDTFHFFDNDCDPDEMLYHKFYQIDVTLPIGIIKEVALSKGHIIDGKGVGILRFRTSVKELKDVAERYGLKKSGTKQVLINRIEDNLTVDEINKEFNGSRFILTPEGERFLKKFDNYNFKYFQSLPECFDPIELDILCQENPQYSIEDIVFAIVKEDWCIIENPDNVSKSGLDSLIFNIHQKRYFLAQAFEKDFPERAIELYESCLFEQLNLHYLERLSKLYHKHGMSDRELEFLSILIDNADELVEINTPKFDKRVYDTKINKILELLNEAIESNSNPDVIRLITKFKDKIKENSVDKDKFIEYNYDYYLIELENLELPINNFEKLEESLDLIYSMESMFFNYELDRYIGNLNGLKAKYDYLKNIS